MMKKRDILRMGDSSIAYISIDAGKCNRCRHVSNDGLTCEAFPEGIPAEILTGKHDHTKAFPGDGGIRFRRWPKA